MKEELRIDIVGLAGACSYALDCIEAELVKIKNKHGKRVAYISVCMAEYLAIQGDALQDLAMCALLHDNALTQYIKEELERNYVIDIKKDLSVRKTNLHCIYGEKNITKLPFKTDVSNVILYHHEHADGTGPFQKKWNETPLPARIIHLADTVDIIGNSIKSDDNRWDFICQYLSQKKDSLFDSECVNDFEEIRDWAAFHHEKLNGKGYPFGKTADELNEQERMMACVDIYQALTEDRPYKKGLSHEKTCDILDDMAHKDFIDSDISKTIRECFGRT